MGPKAEYTTKTPFISKPFYALACKEIGEYENNLEIS